MKRSQAVTIVLIAGLVLGACSSPADVDPQDEAEVGFIHYAGRAGTIDVRGGEELTVHIVTLGRGCARAAGTSVEVAGDTATITPLDYTGGEDEPCPLIVKRLDHEVTIQPAVKFIVVNARRHPTLEPVQVRYILGVTPL